MGYLAAAVVTVGLLCVVNLLLMVGVIRRLRKMAAQPAFGPPAPEGLAIGERIPEFAATTTAGEPISHEILSGPTLIGFFSPSCQPCKEMMPRFIAQAGQSSNRAFAVVVAEADENTAEEIERLSDVGQVVVEAPMGDLQSAFKVRGYPTIYVTDADGTVVGTGLDARVMVDA